MAINTPEDIANLSLSHLGNYGSVSNITTPVDAKELILALWYDITRQSLLKLVMPNFSLARKLVSELVETIPFGYDNVFEYPSDCLKILGLGDVDHRADFIYSVEAHPSGTGLAVYTDDDWEDGMELRYIKDVTLVTAMSPEFKMLFSWYLSANVALPITQDISKKVAIEKLLPAKMSELSAMNAQENRPVRLSNSRFRAARFTDLARNQEKK